MHHSLLFKRGLALVSGFALLVACSSKTDNNPAPTTDDAGATTTPTPTTDGGGTTNKDSGTPAKPKDSGAKPEEKTPDELCAEEKTAEDCDKCCTDGHQDGYDAFVNSIITCGCAEAGPCTTQCAADLCMNPPVNPSATSTCIQCLQDSIKTGGACLNAVRTDCGKSKACQDWIACGQDCPQ